jgi:hypothetical protein
MVAVDVIFFAIRAALRLAEEGRRAIISTTRGRTLVLPLPQGIGADADSAFVYFSTAGLIRLRPGSALEAAYRRVEAVSLSHAPAADRMLLLDTYNEILAKERAERAGDGEIELQDNTRRPAREVAAVFTIRQWERQEEEAFERRLLCRVAGTVVDLAVDYFATVPGALNENSKQGRVLKAVVSALDKLEFAEIDGAKEGWLRQLAERLLLAALETVAENAEQISSDTRVHELVAVAAEGLVRDLERRFESDMPENVRGRLVSWGELVFRSLLNSAGRKIVSEPRLFFGIQQEGRGVLVRRVGHAFIDLAMDEDLDLQRMFGRAGLERVMDAVLSAVGDHPDLLGLTDNEGLTNLLGAIARDVHNLEGLLSVEVAPEIIRLVMERTAENLGQIWPGATPDHPEQHLLLSAVRTTLTLMSAPPPDGAQWTPRFSNRDLLNVLDDVLREVAANPGWLRSGADSIDANLKAALESTLNVLRTCDDRLLSRATGVKILQAAFEAVALRQEFVRQLSGTSKTLVAAIIEKVVQAFFSQSLDEPGEAAAAWQLLRASALETAVTITLEVAGARTLGDPVVAGVESALTTQIQKLQQGARLDWLDFRRDLETALPS